MNKTEWQAAFDACPKIWAIFDPDDYPTNFYESEEATMCEIKFRDKMGHRAGYVVRSFSIHSLELAKVRWDTKGIKSTTVG